MGWLAELFTNSESISTSVLIIALVVSLGLGLGQISVRGIKLGVAGVLFSGLLFGHLALTINHTVLEFVREFGLILFVYAVGLTVGPGFFNAFRAAGVRLNALAGAVVLLGVLLTLVGSNVIGIPRPIAVGMFSGATTNTPSLAAAGQALRENPPTLEQSRAVLHHVGASSANPMLNASNVTPDEQKIIQGEVIKAPGLGYAVTYPFGVFGTILSMMLLRRFCRVDPLKEAQEAEEKLRSERPELVRVSLRVTNQNLQGVRLGKLPGLSALEVRISRILRGNEMHLAGPQFELRVGDILSAVGAAEQVDELRMIVGERDEIDLTKVPSELTFRWLTVTRGEVVNRPIEDLELESRFGVQVTRLKRADVEMPPLSAARLAPGDMVKVVGTASDIAQVASELGDSPKELQQPELIPVFVGIALGVLAGSVPLWLPGLPSPVKLGLAGGPLIVAIVLGRALRLGSLVFYLPSSANVMMKEMGIALFLAAVGLKSGDRFVESIIQGDGFLWMAWGAVITIVPLLVVGLFGRVVMRMQYISLLGVLSGSMTDPPALAFSHSMVKSEIPSISYATVYPLTMILRVLSAQLLIMAWAG